MLDRMVISLPNGLIADFKRGANQLPKVVAFHKGLGHSDIAAALDIAADAAHRL